MQYYTPNFLSDALETGEMDSSFDCDVFNDIIKPMLGDDPTPAITWLMDNGLMPSERWCSVCQNKMKWCKFERCKDKFALSFIYSITDLST